MQEINEVYVNVLLSTYNGDAYLLEQLNSIYLQSYPFIRIYVRDDGSSDLTLRMLRVEQSKGKINLLPQGRNIGPAASFFKLLGSSNEACFFAFCDQDDLWNCDKVERAVAEFSKVTDDVPAMYFSSLECVDKENNYIKLLAPSRKIGFGNALVENVAVGCTVVLNRTARDLIVKNTPKQCLMHDSWCYLVISCFGRVLYDSYPSLRYRQHSNNAIGAATSLMDSLLRRIKRFNMSKSGTFRFSDQASLFLNMYGDTIPKDYRSLLVSFEMAKNSFLGRLRLIINSQFWRQSMFDNFILRLLILLNRY